MQPTASRVIPNRRSVTSSTLTPFSCASFNVRLLSAVGRAASGTRQPCYRYHCYHRREPQDISPLERPPAECHECSSQCPISQPETTRMRVFVEPGSSETRQ